MELIESKAQQINELHSMANSKAAEAIECAIQAGKLLIEVKKALKHGQFLRWVKSNLAVGLRQAQRYIAAAEGKCAPIRSLTVKSVMVSHLETSCDQGLVVDGNWVPTRGYCYAHCSPEGAYWVVSDLMSGGFHVSKFYQCERDPSVDPEFYADPDDPFDTREWDGMSLYDGSNHAMRVEMVDPFLRFLGLKDPSTASWNTSVCAGLPRPFGEPKTEDHEGD